MIIDKNGIIRIENLGLKIDPDFTLNELKSNPHFGDFKFNGSNDGYERYGLGEVLIDNLPFFASLYFYKNKISQIGLSYALYKYIPGEDWEKQKEIVDLTRKKHDELMLEQHGATSIIYLWGSVGSFLDDRFGYSAGITIRYNWSHQTDTTFIQSMPPNMLKRIIIDENGYIDLLNTKLVITPKLTLEEVKNDPKSSSFKYFGWWDKYCDLGSVIIDQLPFEVTLSFNSRTKLISELWMSFSGFMGNKTVDLTPQKINSTKHFHDEWILTLKGGIINKKELSQGKFIIEAVYPWGTICSTLGRENRPEIIVKYNE